MRDPTELAQRYAAASPAPVPCPLGAAVVRAELHSMVTCQF